MKTLVLREANRSEVLALNHQTDPYQRVTALQCWAKKEFPAGHDASWFELSGAASAGLTIFALLALAADHRCSEADAARTAHAYYPWPGALATMLDSYVDRLEDIATEAHIYVDYYQSNTETVKRIGELIRNSLNSLGTLPLPQKHIVIIASMVAMYLTKNSVRGPDARRATAAIVTEGGSLTLALLPVLRTWRTMYQLRDM